MEKAHFHRDPRAAWAHIHSGVGGTSEFDFGVRNHTHAHHDGEVLREATEREAKLCTFLVEEFGKVNSLPDETSPLTNAQAEIEPLGDTQPCLRFNSNFAVPEDMTVIALMDEIDGLIDQAVSRCLKMKDSVDFIAKAKAFFGEGK